MNSLTSASVGGPVGQVIREAGRYFDVNARREVEIQTLLWQGRGRHLVRRYLADQGMGIANDAYPLQVGLLRHVVDQLSVIYRTPPTRYLTQGPIRVGDEDTAQTILWEQYERAHVDAVLREVDTRRSLWRTAFVRVYASDAAQRVKLAVFPPTAVYREPEPGEPDDLRADRRIVVERSDQTCELFERTDEGWRLTMYNSHGVPSGEPETLDVLPLVGFWDGLPDLPYLHPYEHRTEYMMKLAMIANELPASIKYNVHPRSTMESDALTGDQQLPEVEPPVDIGPGVLAALAPGERMVIHELNPKIEAIASAVAEVVREWFRTESLPTDDFRSSQAVSALGLRVLSEPLKERRERLAPFARESEVRLFDAFRYMHNLHNEDWNQPFIAEGRGLEVVLGTIDVPTAPSDHLEVLSREMALGLQSRLGALMSYRGLTRREALSELLQVEEDRAAFRLDRDDEPAPEIEGAASTATDPDDVLSDGASMLQLAARAQEA